jgi:hypothetical protein
VVISGAAAVAVCLVVAVHFAFIGYLVVGGFIARWWPRTIWLHIPVVLWGIGSVALGLTCPVTDLERWARARAGMDALPPDGFIAHYITGVLYPASLTTAVQVIVAAIVLTSWVLFVVGRRSRSDRVGVSHGAHR